MALPTKTRRRPSGLAAIALCAVLGLLAGCGGDDSGPRADQGPATELRLGYFANVTHAAALVGVQEKLLEQRLGTTKLTTQVFNAGPAAIEAIFGGAIDASYIGPNPAINAFVQSHGEAIRIIAGATSGGAALVVRPEINSAEDLRGKTVATPQLGNTQDVALRAWLADNGLQTSKTGQGDVTIQAGTENATTLQLFQDGAIDGAWLPEPWVTRLVQEAGAKVLVDEKTLWPDGRFVATHLIVATRFLEEHPQTVRALLEAHVDAVQWISEHPDQARSDVNTQIGELTGKPLPPQVLDGAWQNIEVTVDPVASSLVASAEHAAAADLIEQPDLAGIYHLGPLNEILRSRGLAAVSDAGLGSG
ncbi:MAG: ABC transporter substrate-binding protein [Sporichthyaceae bacterium]|nr:ABC transporter substrate-binding protein [Sporichthyaceae bacterium]